MVHQSINNYFTTLHSRFLLSCKPADPQIEFRLILISIFVSRVVRQVHQIQQKIIPVSYREEAKASAITDLLLSRNHLAQKSDTESVSVSLGSKSDPVALISTVPCIPLFSKICKTISLVLDVMRC